MIVCFKVNLAFSILGVADPIPFHSIPFHSNECLVIPSIQDFRKVPTFDKTMRHKWGLLKTSPDGPTCNFTEIVIVAPQNLIMVTIQEICNHGGKYAVRFDCCFISAEYLRQFSSRFGVSCIPEPLAQVFLAGIVINPHLLQSMAIKQFIALFGFIFAVFFKCIKVPPIGHDTVYPR